MDFIFSGKLNDLQNLTEWVKQLADQRL